MRIGRLAHWDRAALERWRLLRLLRRAGCGCAEPWLDIRAGTVRCTQCHRVADTNRRGSVDAVRDSDHRSVS